MLPLIGDVAKLIDSFVGKLAGDKSERDKASAELAAQMNALYAAQSATNTEQAKHSSLFVAGARPFVMWVCGIAFAYKYVLYPFAQFLLIAAYPEYAAVELPVIDSDELTTVLLGMLGLGGLRTYEKTKGVETNRLSK